MALLRDETELIWNFDEDMVFKLFAEVYDDGVGIELDRKLFEYTSEGVTYHGHIRVKESIKSTIESLNICNIPFIRVRGSFICARAFALKSLEGAPEVVDGDFVCAECSSLTDLKGAPKTVKKAFHCYYCKNLESLEGAPRLVGKDFDCSGCAKLKNLKGAPKKVGGDFNCNECNIETFDGIMTDVKERFLCYKNPTLRKKMGVPECIGKNQLIL